MRAKTLGVFLITAFAFFTALYWMTDSPRREARFESDKEELLAYGQELFGPPTPQVPVTAYCARCHGADGTGGEVGDTGRRAPNLHSPSIAQKLKVNPNYVNLVIRYGGVVVSGKVNSPMPAWSTEAGGPPGGRRPAACGRGRAGRSRRRGCAGGTSQTCRARRTRE